MSLPMENDALAAYRARCAMALATSRPSDAILHGFREAARRFARAQCARAVPIEQTYGALKRAAESMVHDPLERRRCQLLLDEILACCLAVEARYEAPSLQRQRL